MESDSKFLNEIFKVPSPSVIGEYVKIPPPEIPTTDTKTTDISL